MNEGTQFKTIAILVVLALGCVVGIGVLIVLKTVTEANSFGIDGIVATLKDALLMLLGALAAMVKQPNTPGSITVAAPVGNAAASTTTASINKETPTS